MSAAPSSKLPSVASPATGSRLDRRARIGFGVANVVIAITVLGGVFRYLPTRWWPVDVGAVVVASLLAASGVTLLRNAAIAERITRIAAGVVLVIGLALFAALALTASWISGVYGQVGAGGAVVFGLVAALVFPYLVILPAAELAWVGPRARKPIVDEIRAVPERDKKKKSTEVTTAKRPAAMKKHDTTAKSAGHKEEEDEE